MVVRTSATQERGRTVTEEEIRGDDLIRKPDISVPVNGRVTVERWIGVSKTRVRASEHASGLVEGGSCDEPVRFVAENYGARTLVHVEIGADPDTRLHLDLDTLVEVAVALCPPYLLRKKLGL